MHTLRYIVPVFVYKGFGKLRKTAGPRFEPGTVKYDAEILTARKDRRNKLSTLFIQVGDTLNRKKVFKLKSIKRRGILFGDKITLMLRVYSPAFNDACVVEECVQGAVFPEQTVPQMSTAALLAARGRTPLVTLVRLTAQDRIER